MTIPSTKSVVKALIPQRYHHTARLIGYRAAWYGTDRYCPCCESRVRRFLPFGATMRDNALCPVCEALERHRMLTLFIRRNLARLADAGRTLHVAPERGIAQQLERLPGTRCISIDLERSGVTLNGDLTALPLADRSFGGVCCSHVLEHVPDDRAAMAELYRVLRPGGWALVQVPIRRGRTIEDPTVKDPLQRRMLFGQRDHVRHYGLDLEDRLRETGFQVEVDRPSRRLTEDAAQQMGLNRGGDEEVFFCTRRG